MLNIIKFFSVTDLPKKLNIELSEQRKIWFKEFIKVFAVVFIVYAAMYLIRNNFKASQGFLKDQLGFTTTQLGQIGFIFSITYGLGKVILGYIADGRNTKRILSGLLTLSAICILLMGILLAGSDRPAMGLLLLLWGLNGVFQSIGGPLSYATILKWTPRVQRGRYMGLWNTSHNIGGAIAGILALFGANYFFQGRVSGMFIFPAIIALVIGLITLFIGKESPEAVGLEKAEVLFNEPVSELEVASNQMSKKEIFLKWVLTNPWVWLLCLANITVYIIRIGIDNWAPLYTKEVCNFSMSMQVNTLFYFEMGALVASLFLGYLADLCKGRYSLVGVFCFILIIFAIIGYRHSSSPVMVNTFLFILGLLIFGPQLLIGVAVVSLVPKKVAATTNGMTGTFGYLFGDSMAKVGLAAIADPTTNGLTLFGKIFHGWNDTFTIFYYAAIIGIILLGIVALKEETLIRVKTNN